MGQQWERSLFCQFQLLGSYWKVHWLKLAPGLKKVQWGKPTPPNIFFRPILPNFEKKLKSETMILGGGPCSQSVRRKHWTQSQKDNRNNLIHHLDRREASSRLHSVVAYSVSNKTWAKCPASFSSGFWSASIQKEPPPLSFDFVTHSASGFDFLEAVLHLFCSDQSVAKVLAECTRKAGGQPERPSMLQTLQPQY